MDGGVWRATVYGVAKSQMRLSTQPLTTTNLLWLDSLYESDHLCKWNHTIPTLLCLASFV